MKQKVNNIQALRALAALGVVVFHTGFVLPHLRPIGSFGVDIFFVISGYIMARICETNSTFFLRRRLIRIVPPYWAMTLLLFCVALRFPALMDSTRASGTELFKSLLFIPYYKANGFLHPLLFVGWSLNYEMFFYVAIWAGLLLVPKRPLLFASAAILTICALCSAFRSHGALAAFYGSPVTIEFVLGILAYEIARRVKPAAASRIRTYALSTLVVCVLGIVGLQATIGPQLAFGWVLGEALAMGTVLSASLMSQGAWDINLAWVVLIGDASYILYLVHPYCEYLIGRVIVPVVPVLNITHPFGATIAIAFSVVTAILLHLKLEKPAVAFLNQRFGGRRKSAEFRGEQATPQQVAP